MANVHIMGVSHTTLPATDEEKALFEAVFNTMIGALTSEERALFKQRKDVIYAGLEIAKAVFDNKRFMGFNPADTDIGIQFIRPEYLNRNDWKVTFSTAGSWVGFVNDGSSADAMYSLSEDLLLIKIGTASLSTVPKIDEEYTKVGKLEYSPYVLTNIKLKDNENRVYIYPTPTVIVEPKQSFVMKVRSYETGDDIIRPIGIVYGLGRTLNKLSITVDTPAHV